MYQAWNVNLKESWKLKHEKMREYLQFQEIV